MANIIIQQFAGFCVQKINILLILGVTLIMINCTCNAKDTHEVDLHVKAFKWYAVFVWKEKSIYQFVWHVDTNVLIERKIISKKVPVNEHEVEENMNKMKGLENSMKVFFIENPHSSTFIDDKHDPMRPREEFSDLVDRLSDLAKINEIDIIFLDSHNTKNVSWGF